MSASQSLRSSGAGEGREFFATAMLSEAGFRYMLCEHKRHGS